MIYESGPWRDQLTRAASELSRLASQRRMSERRSVLIERSLVFGAFIMRKLDDSQKLSTGWAATRIEATRHPLIGAVPDSLDMHHLERHYDLAPGTPDNCTSREFCNRVIHSFGLVETYATDGTLAGFLVNSDKTRKDAIWFFSVQHVVDLLIRTAKDQPTTVRLERDPATGAFRSWRGHGEPPPR